MNITGNKRAGLWLLLALLAGKGLVATAATTKPCPNHELSFALGTTLRLAGCHE